MINGCFKLDRCSCQMVTLLPNCLIYRVFEILKFINNWWMFLWWVIHLFNFLGKKVDLLTFLFEAIQNPMSNVFNSLSLHVQSILKLLYHLFVRTKLIILDLSYSEQYIFQHCFGESFRLFLKDCFANWSQIQYLINTVLLMSILVHTISREWLHHWLSYWWHLASIAS